MIELYYYNILKTVLQLYKLSLKLWYIFVKVNYNIMHPTFEVNNWIKNKIETVKNLPNIINGRTFFFLYKSNNIIQINKLVICKKKGLLQHY